MLMNWVSSPWKFFSNSLRSFYVCVCVCVRGADKWSPALQIRTVLLSIQALLSAPNPDDPLANDVAEQWKKNESKAIETGSTTTSFQCRCLCTLFLHVSLTAFPLYFLLLFSLPFSLSLPLSLSILQHGNGIDSTLPLSRKLVPQLLCTYYNIV